MTPAWLRCSDRSFLFTVLFLSLSRCLGQDLFPRFVSQCWQICVSTSPRLEFQSSCVLLRQILLAPCWFKWRSYCCRPDALWSILYSHLCLCSVCFSDMHYRTLYLELPNVCLGGHRSGQLCLQNILIFIQHKSFTYRVLLFLQTRLQVCNRGRLLHFSFQNPPRILYCGKFRPKCSTQPHPKASSHAFEMWTECDFAFSC